VFIEILAEAAEVAPAPPNHDWLIGSAVTAVLSFLGIVWVKHDTRVTREQTENSHADSEYPNMRDHMDAIHEDVKKAEIAAREAQHEATAAKEKAGEVEENQHRHDAEIRGIRKDIGNDREATRKVGERVDGHIEETRREYVALTRKLDIRHEQAKEQNAELRGIVSDHISASEADRAQLRATLRGVVQFIKLPDQLTDHKED
jgi:chromosome segregation ATPase